MAGNSQRRGAVRKDNKKHRLKEVEEIVGVG